MLELVEPGTYVGMKSPTNAIESIFIAEVPNKGITKKNVINKNGHHILSGEKYLEIFYLQEKRTKKELK